MVLSALRYALNIKCIPYKTVWVELPDIEPLCKQLGAPPGGRRPGPLYTLPVIYDPNTKRHIADSSTIVRYLDDAYPSAPRLFPEGTDALHAAFQHAFQAVLFSGSGALVTIMRPVTYSALSPGRVQEYFTKTREEWFGKLDDVGPRGSPKHQGAWKELEDAFHTIAGWLVVSTTDSHGKERLFFGGDDTIIFADVTVAGFLKCLQVMYGQDSEEWQGVLRWDGGRWARSMEAFRRYDMVDAGSIAVLDM